MQVAAQGWQRRRGLKERKQRRDNRVKGAPGLMGDMDGQKLLGIELHSI